MRAGRISSCVLAAVLGCAAAGCGDACEPGEERCDGDYLAHCEQCGEPGCTADWRLEHCGGTCVSTATDAPFCSESEHPDPRCAQQQRFCDGDTIVRCRGGYRDFEEPCPGQLACVEPALDAGAAPQADGPTCERATSP